MPVRSSPDQPKVRPRTPPPVQEEGTATPEQRTRNLGLPAGALSSGGDYAPVPRFLPER